MIYGDGLANTVSLNAGGSGLGQFAVGTFMATATSQSLTLSTGNVFSDVHITGLQVRDVPAPEASALVAMILGLLTVYALKTARRGGVKSI